MRKLVLLALVGLGVILHTSFISAQATVCVSVKNGDWDVTSTWNKTPSSCNIFYIYHKVSIPNNSSISLNDVIIFIESTGSLIVTNGETLTLTNSTILVESGGKLDIGNGSSLSLDNSTLSILDGGILTSQPSGNSVIVSNGITYTGQSEFNIIVAGGGLSPDGTVLPIELTSFLGKRVNNTIELAWRTASEYNNSFVEVQRSKDGKNFEMLRQVPSKTGGYSTTPLDYRVTDEQPLPGVNYYRLRQVDFDGKAHFHQVIAVLFNDEGKQQAITVFPTIVNDQLNVALSKEADADGVLYINDLNGRILQNISFERGAQQWSLDVKNLPAGQFVIVINNGREVQVARFVKQ